MNEEVDSAFRQNPKIRQEPINIEQLLDRLCISDDRGKHDVHQRLATLEAVHNNPQGSPHDMYKARSRKGQDKNAKLLQSIMNATDY